MARGKYNKRGGGSRFAATSAEEIEQRNARLEELDEQRSKRREEAEKEEQQQAEAVGERVASMKIGSSEGETRKQREDRQKEEARAAYRKKHEAGLTEEYKRDMEKLAEVKKRREAAAAKAKMEEDAAKTEEEDRKKKVAAANTDNGEKKKKKKEGIPKLDKITIKVCQAQRMILRVCFFGVRASSLTIPFSSSRPIIENETHSNGGSAKGQRIGYSRQQESAHRTSLKV